MRQRGIVAKSSLLAGFFIGIAGLGYLQLGGFFGAVIFCVGLIGCVIYNLKLYTGLVGYVRWGRGVDEIPSVLLWNVIGCLLIALLAKECLPGIEERAQEVVTIRLGKSWFQAGLLGIGCGFLVTFAVSRLKSWTEEKQRSWLPLLFAVPTFIICGFLHSIADSFYFFCCGWGFLGENWLDVIIIWVSVVIGNLIGCNIPRIFLINERV